MEAHCKHLGAHIGHGGTVVGDCVQCPFHGWRWGPTALIGISPTSRTGQQSITAAGVPSPGAVRLRVHLASARRQGAAVGDARYLPQVPAIRDRSAAYYRAYPEFSRRAEREPVHPQIVAENAPDSAHFDVHRATVTQRVLDWKIVDQEWQFVAGWPDASSDNAEDLALRFHSHLFGLGGAISVFEGAQNHRLIFTCTPVDDECSDLFFRSGGPGYPATPPTYRMASCATPSKRISCQRSSTISDLALPEVCGKSRAVQRGCERLYGLT